MIWTMTRRGDYRRILVIGDVHGSLVGLRTILQEAGVMDSSERWTGGRTIVVQTGDVIDRGSDARGCLDLLHRLRLEARREGGGVDLLLGNHEMALIQGELWMSDDPNPLDMAERLRRELRRGQWVAARAMHRYLITHAGVCSKLLETLIHEIRAKADQHRVTVAAIARHLNELVEYAVSTNDYSHAIFGVGPSRGGPHTHGGIFWADFDDEHSQPARGLRIWQVFGHTPPLRTKGQLFRMTADRMRINADIGICEVYGGNLGYLELERDQVIGVLVGNKPERQVLVKTEDVRRAAAMGQELAAS
jgi:hypothetical protein